MNLKSIVQEAAKRIGLTPPDAVVTSTEETARRMHALVNQEGHALMRRHDWDVLTFEQVISTVASETQPGAIPADLDRVIGETAFNRSQRRALRGPVSAAEWQRLKSGGALVATGRPFFRARGSNLLLLPAPPAGETVAFEYVSRNWAASEVGEPRSSMQVDTDVPLLDEEIVILGIVWRFKAAKGLEYAEDFRAYEAAIASRISHDGAKAVIDLTGPSYQPAQDWTVVV
jgi:hypothetical protein